MKFWGFPKSGIKFSKYISFQKFFFFLKIYFERKFSPDFGKFHDFVFLSPEFKQKSFPAGKDFPKLSISFPVWKESKFKKHFFSFKDLPPLKNIFSPKKMINLLQETKKKVEEKNLLSRFPEFDRRSIFAAALYEKLAAVPAENILKSETNIGLLGREDECECLSELFFMRAHGIIHDACGRAYCEMGVGKGYCYAVENPTIFMKSSPFLGHISGIAFCIWNRKKLRKIFE